MSNNIPDYKNNLYFDSQNTKNEQQKDLCIISEQLTEQWKKGELPVGWYYTKLWKGCIVIDYFIGNQFLRYDNSDIVEIIAPVPTFNELQNMNKAVNDCMTSNIKLVGQNKQLKELLKKLYKQADVSYCEETLLDKIDEVLK